MRAPTPPRDQDARPGQRDDGLEASSATRIMAKSAASGVTGRRQPQIPIPIGIPMHMHDGAAPGPIALVQTMHVSEMHQQMPAPSPQISAPSQHDLKIITDPLAATELQNHQLQLQLAQTVHAMDQMRQFGSASPLVSMPSQTAHMAPLQNSRRSAPWYRACPLYLLRSSAAKKH